MKTEHKEQSKDGLLKEALRICKESRTNFERYEDPWDNPRLTTAKLTHINFETKTAEVIKGDTESTVKLIMDQSTLNTLHEIGGYYGATAFLDQDNNLVNVSYLSPWNGTLTHAEYGVDVYE